ncbi:MAG: tRNA preQ1(34) S-adenosylmethionine ribosyltransferase-isomerase QueA [Anaerolineales bacterium]|nr:tRNA preQ1(34) S-adenosylmethionine ribosyltransferase-isomerase QueA [Anaerolineales bacterium]
MKTASFDYDLPQDRIAQVPVEPRDSAKLMVLNRQTGQIDHKIFKDLTDYVQPGDMMVFNNTRVIPARLFSRKVATGGRIELLLLDQIGPQTWRTLVGGRRVRPGTVLELLNHQDENSGVLAEIKEIEKGKGLIEFRQPASKWLAALGHTPLPPYIRNYTGNPARYQTIYAKEEGSAAAPTAGLHFTGDLLLELREKGVRFGYVTLQIGLDTFKPIKEDDIEGHIIHTEWAQLRPDTARMINETKLAGGKVIAVGTTSVRTLESAAIKSACDNNSCGWQTVSAFEGATDLYITPGYDFRVVDTLVTNFHLPRSTLIVLVSAFSSLETIKRAYARAIELDYRFYSFGDAMLIL